MFENSPSPKKSKRDHKRNDQPRKKIPRKITETYLHNAGLYYLERFSSSAENFRAVMLRKVKKSCMHHLDQDYEQCAELVDKTVKKFIEIELLDDAVYTRSKVNALRRQGKSSRFIHGALRLKGLNPDLVTKTLNELDQLNHEDTQAAEYEAARTFARKKRLGQHRIIRPNKEPDPQKELAKMARAGFSYDTAQRVLKEE